MLLHYMLRHEFMIGNEMWCRRLIASQTTPLPIFSVFCSALCTLILGSLVLIVQHHAHLTYHHLAT